MTRRMSSSRVVLTATFLALAAGGLAACDDGVNDYEDGHFYCTDANGVIVDESRCDDSAGGGGGGYFFMFMGNSMHAPPTGSSSYPVGHRLPPNTPKISITDKAARKQFGLPPSGAIRNGTVKTGVIGKGGPRSSLKGSGGGGGKSSGGG
jgi:hypothetical protein